MKKKKTGQERENGRKRNVEKIVYLAASKFVIFSKY